MNDTKSTDDNGMPKIFVSQGLPFDPTKPVSTSSDIPPHLRLVHPAMFGHYTSAQKARFNELRKAKPSEPTTFTKLG